MALEKTLTEKGVTITNAYWRITDVRGDPKDPKRVTIAAFSSEANSNLGLKNRLSEKVFFDLGARSFGGDDGSKTDLAFWYEKIKAATEDPFFSDAQDV